MFRSKGDGELYAYIPKNQESGFQNRHDVIYNPDYGQSMGRGQISFQVKSNDYYICTSVSECTFYVRFR